MKYRLYIDEVGHSNLGNSLNPENKYLSLTGVGIELGYVERVLNPQMERFKRKFFHYHVDEPIILHRKEVLYKRNAFSVLKNPQIESEFNNDLLTLIEDWKYMVFTVVIDQLEHKNRYETWRFEPYHYCLRILLERFILWLASIDAVGDVMAESRGGKQDMKLKKSYKELFESGTDYVKTIEFQDRLTSCQLKVKPKSNNISGLQLADLIAYPSYKYVVAYYIRKKLQDDFSAKIVRFLKSNKYYRSKYGKIEGWGIKLLP